MLEFKRWLQNPAKELISDVLSMRPGCEGILYLWLCLTLIRGSRSKPDIVSAPSCCDCVRICFIWSDLTAAPTISTTAAAAAAASCCYLTLYLPSFLPIFPSPYLREERMCVCTYVWAAWICIHTYILTTKVRFFSFLFACTNVLFTFSVCRELSCLMELFLALACRAVMLVNVEKKKNVRKRA